MKKKTLSLLLAGILAAGALTGCGGSTDSAAGTSDGTEAAAGELVVLRDAVMTGQLDQYATEIGKWQGIFEQHGIDLQTTEFVAGIYTIDAVVTGTADIGMMADYAAVNRLGNTLEETDLLIFSELSGAGALTGGLYVAPEYVDNLDALDGSTGFMTMTGTVTDYYTSQAIAYLGFDESEQNIIATDSSQTQLALAQSGGASAVVATGSNASYLEDYDWQLAVSSQDMGIETGGYFLAKDSFIEENTEVLAEFLQAVYESAQYIDANLDACAEYLEDDLGVKAEDFKLQWNTYQIKTGFSEEAAQHLDEIENWAYEHGRFDTDYNIRDFIDTSVVEIAFPENVTIQK
jgi:NitT/TauT family transport system substrate-binding protein